MALYTFLTKTLVKPSTKRTNENKQDQLNIVIHFSYVTLFLSLYASFTKIDVFLHISVSSTLTFSGISELWKFALYIKNFKQIYL